MKILLNPARAAKLFVLLLFSQLLSGTAVAASPIVDDPIEIKRGRIDHVDLPVVTISDRGYLVSPSTKILFGRQPVTASSLSKGMIVTIKAGPRNSDGIRSLLEVNAGR